MSEIIINHLLEFAKSNSLILEQKGEVGFGRACVGFISKLGNYVDINPTSHQDYEYVFNYDERLYAPDDVQAYHKHDCFCVLAHGEDEPDYYTALNQLYDWLVSLQSKGKLFVESYATGASGLQAMISGTVGYALRME